MLWVGAKSSLVNGDLSFLQASLAAQPEVLASLAASGVSKRHESIANRKLSDILFVSFERDDGVAKVDQVIGPLTDKPFRIRLVHVAS